MPQRMLPQIRRTTVIRRKSLLTRLVKSPPEKWDEILLQEYAAVHRRTTERQPGADEELKELGEIATAFRATHAYQNRAQ